MMASFKMKSILALFAASTVALSACEKDPYDPQTWIDKLDDSTARSEAIVKLDQLHCPEAITPLGKIWEKNNKPSKILSLLISLANQPEMVKGYEKFPDQDCPDAGEGPYWDDAVPFLITALEDFDVTSTAEIEDAAKAAEALGKAKSPDAVQVLITAATKKEKLRQGQLVRIAAVKALGGYGDQARTVETIIKVLEIKASAKTIYMNKAAAQALAEARSPKSVVPLMKAMYNIPPIYHQIRTALTNIGKPAATELLKAFQGTQAEINKLAVAGKFATDCETAEGLDSTCIAPGNVRFKAASVLGDMRAKEAIPAFLAALKTPERISFYDQNSGAPGPSDHNAILNALRSMGAYESAGAVAEYMKAEGTNILTRPLAVDVYSMLAKDTSQLEWLKTTMTTAPAENDRLMPLRQASMLAYARLAKSEKDLAPIDAKIKSALAAAAQKEAAAAKVKDGKDEKGKEKAAEKKKALLDDAKFKRQQAVQYEQHRTRARVGILCGNKLACYQEFLEMDAKSIVAKLKIPNHVGKKPMKLQDMEAYRIAALERSLLEITKMGKAAEPAFAMLLKHADSSERIIRQGVLLAMIQVAPTPCNACAERLNQVMTMQASMSTLNALNSDTRIIFNYFINQGAKLSADGPAAPAAPAEKK